LRRGERRAVRATYGRVALNRQSTVPALGQWQDPPVHRGWGRPCPREARPPPAFGGRSLW